MTQITAQIVERNPRDAEVAISNGLTFAAVGFPALTGSAKQIAWADRIRADAIDACEQRMRALLDGKFRNGHGSCQEFDDFNGLLGRRATRLAQAIDALTDAKWWIDNRDVLSCALPEMVERHILKSAKPPVDEPGARRPQSYVVPVDEREAMVEDILQRRVWGVGIDDQVPERRDPALDRRPVDAVREAVKQGLCIGQVVKAGHHDYIYNGDGTITLVERHFGIGPDGRHRKLRRSTLAETPALIREMITLAALSAAWPMVKDRSTGSVIPANW
jgi:hypothetical protein